MKHEEFSKLVGNGARQEAIYALLFEIRDLLKQNATPFLKAYAPEAPKKPVDDPLLDIAPQKQAFKHRGKR